MTTLFKTWVCLTFSLKRGKENPCKATQHLHLATPHPTHKLYSAVQHARLQAFCVRRWHVSAGEDVHFVPPRPSPPPLLLSLALNGSHDNAGISNSAHVHQSICVLSSPHHIQRGKIIFSFHTRLVAIATRVERTSASPPRTHA